MKHFKLLGFLLLPSLLICCGKTATTIKSDMELTGKWQLQSVESEKGIISKPPGKTGLYDVSLTFKEKGELEATSSNNYLTGFYEVAQLNAIQLWGDGTERKETSWGNLFANSLPHVNLYDLKPDKLILFCDNNSKLIFYKVSQN